MMAIVRCDGRQQPDLPDTIVDGGRQYAVSAEYNPPFSAGFAAGARDHRSDCPGKISMPDRSRPGI